MTDVFLYEGEANPNDIKVTKPSVVRGTPEAILTDVWLRAGEVVPSDVRLYLPGVSAGVTYYGILKRWTGAAWVKALLKVFVGGSWQTKLLKRWDGSEWKLVDTTGV